MGRKHRSSSLSNGNNNSNASFSAAKSSSSSTSTTKAVSSSSSANTTHNPEDVVACHSLLHHFIHGKDDDGRTVLHRAIEAASSSSSYVETEDEKLDGLYLTDALSTRLKEFDNRAIVTMTSKVKGSGKQNNNNNNSNSLQQQQNSHFHRMMLAQDAESGYTPLHYAILRRDLTTLLVLLKHMSSSISLFDGTDNAQMMQHPLRLLHGNIDGNVMRDNDEQYCLSIINDLAASWDHEKLTPLQLLGRTSSNGLENCRRTLQWKSLRKGWKKNQQQQQQQQLETSLEHVDRTNDSNTNPRRYRRRMISFGDERDHDSLNYEIEEDPDTRLERERRRRSRSGSFNVDLDDDGHDRDDDDAEEEEDGGERNPNGTNNDLIPLDDNVNFNALVNNENNGGNDPPTPSNGPARSNGLLTSSSRRYRAALENDYGCEVLTFGGADHCALGVPQFTTSGRIRGRSHGEGDNFSSLSASSSSTTTKTTTETTSYKPKRVEAFALGELRRAWSSSSDPSRTPTTPSSSSCSGNEKERRGGGFHSVDSPAVAIAAASHHTLVSTRSGRLFSFGLGKGGRLGTGDENHRPLPTRIMGPLTNRIVASIAAAENHSLCSTSDGDVYAWGSNGFGQLGILSLSSQRDHSGQHHQQQSQDQNSSGSNNSRLSPRRVEGGELKHCFVVAVAAGDRHSVALTRLGEVYCWGDNRSGQLGTYNSALLGGASSAASSASPSSSQTNNGRCCHRPQRVEGLWSNQPRRRAIAIAAAEFSTLVLTMPPTVSAGESSLAVSLPVNTIYRWGHGNHSPLRVNFPPVAGGSGTNGNSTYARSICINPVAIACAKYHSVAITADGRVYTWGLHSESLGIEKSPNPSKSSESDWATSEGGKSRHRSQGGSSSSSSKTTTISSPQLVVGMLPENGGGTAIAVSASENHTAVVTSDGHLFTWGTSHGNDVLGHRGVRWQPIPRRVERVHRAVGVAAAKEHTALLMGTSFPPLFLQEMSQGAFPDVMPTVDPLSLQDSAAVEISRNVDLFNVIPVALVAHRLNCQTLIRYCDEFVQNNLDGVLAVGNKNDFATFLSSKTFVGVRNHVNDGVFHPFLYHLAKSKGWAEDGRVLLSRYAGSMRRPKKIGKRSKRGEQTVALCKETEKGTASDKATETKTMAEEKRAPCAEKPQKIVVEEIEEQKPAIVRKLFLEPAIGGKARGDATTNYRCVVCDISCPDSDSYTFHMNGRKHRNRLMHAKAEEEKKVAESMMAMKRMQLMANHADLVLQEGKLHNGTKSESAWAIPKAVTPRAAKPTYPVKKAGSKSFQDILSEEQEKSSNNIVKAGGTFLSPITTKAQGLKSMIPVATSHMKPAPPVAYNSAKKPFPITSPGPSLPLSAFMKKSGSKKPDAMSSIGASWGTKLSSKNSSSAGRRGATPAARKTVPMQQHSAPSKMKSFSEIQQEEQAVRNIEDHMCQIDGNQWYVQQRERAASIGEIQEKEKQEREMLDLIEEQRQIEKEIRIRLKQEETAKKQQGGGNRRRKKNSKKSGDNVKSEKNPVPNHNGVKKSGGNAKPKRNPMPNQKKSGGNIKSKKKQVPNHNESKKSSGNVESKKNPAPDQNRGRFSPNVIHGLHCCSYVAVTKKTTYQPRNPDLGLVSSLSRLRSLLSTQIMEYLNSEIVGLKNEAQVGQPVWSLAFTHERIHRTCTLKSIHHETYLKLLLYYLTLNLSRIP